MKELERSEEYINIKSVGKLMEERQLGWLEHLHKMKDKATGVVCGVTV